MFIINKRLDYLINEEYMLKGFKYMADRDSNFLDIIQNLYNKIVTIKNKPTFKAIKKFKEEISDFIDSYTLDLDRFYKCVIKNIYYTNPFDGEIMLAELYYKAQIYFLYNEVFTYGRIDKLFRAQITGSGLDVQNTLYALSNYRATAIFEVYKNIKKITVPNNFKGFLNKYKKNRVFSIKIKKIRSNIEKYFPKSLSLKEFYILANQTRIIKFKKNKTVHIDKKIILLYNTIIEIQRKLFITQNIYEKTFNLLLKRFKNLEEYSGTKSKTNLINLYLDKINELKEYTLTYPKVYYKNYIIDVEEGKKYKLSKTSSKIVDEVISQKKFSRPLIEILKVIGKLEGLGILKKRSIVTEPKRYIVMLELSLSCNLQCKICFNRNFERSSTVLSLDEWEKVSILIPKGSLIILFGGEPFVYNKINELITFIQKYNSTNKMGWKLEIFSNGVLTNRILDTLKDKEKLKLIISIDGLKETHDYIRGKGVFDNTINTIEKIKSETNHIVEVRSVVTTLNMNELTRMVKFFTSIKVNSLKFSDLHLEGNAMKHTDYLLSGKKRISVMKTLNTLLGEYVILGDAEQKEVILLNNCGFGYNRIYIRSDGFVTSCPELDITKKNIRSCINNNNGNLRSLLPKLERDKFRSKLSDCTHCGLLNMCGSGCRIRAFRYYKGIEKCDLQQKKDVEVILNEFIK